MADILSQEEIDALLSALSSGEIHAEQIQAEAQDKAGDTIADRVLLARAGDSVSRITPDGQTAAH